MQKSMQQKVLSSRNVLQCLNSDTEVNISIKKKREVKHGTNFRVHNTRRLRADIIY